MTLNIILGYCCFLFKSVFMKNVKIIEIIRQNYNILMNKLMNDSDGFSIEMWMKERFINIVAVPFLYNILKCENIMSSVSI